MHHIKFPIELFPDFFEVLSKGLGADRPLKPSEKRSLAIHYCRYLACAGFGLKPSKLFEGLSGNAVKAAYKQTYVGGRLADLRTAIRKAAKGRCPSCGRTDPDELDHYLPISKFSEFALFPFNLVPLCGGCNRKKLARVADNPIEAFIHPYFDVIPDVPLHNVKVVGVGKSLTATLTFDGNKVTDVELAARMANQFTFMDVNYQVSFEVETTLREIADALNEEFIVSDVNMIALYLTKVADRVECTFNKGYWKVALYRALANNVSFCDEGWK